MVVGQQINMRFDPEIVAKIDELVRSGEFENRTEFVKYCVRMTLASFKSRSPPPLVNESPHGDCTSFRSRISEAFLLFVR